MIDFVGHMGILLCGHTPYLGMLSFALNGIIANSVVSLTSAYLSTLAPMQQQTHFWGIFTIAAALCQTAGGTLMAHWMGAPWCYPLMFSTTTLAMFLAALLVSLSLMPRIGKSI